MSYPGSPAPGMVGGIAVDSTALTAFDALEKVQLLFDKNTGALLTTAVGNVSGGTQVEGIHTNNTQVSNPLPTGGFANNGDGVTVVGLRAAFNGGDSMGTLFVQLDPALTSTVAVSGVTTTAFRSRTATNTDTTISASPGGLYAINVVNLLASVIYLKFFDAASVTVGTTVPNYTLQIPASGVWHERGADLPYRFATAIHCIITTVSADTGTQTAAGTLPILELETGA